MIHFLLLTKSEKTPTAADKSEAQNSSQVIPGAGYLLRNSLGTTPMRPLFPSALKSSYHCLINSSDFFSPLGLRTVDTICLSHSAAVSRSFFSRTVAIVGTFFLS